MIMINDDDDDDDILAERAESFEKCLKLRDINYQPQIPQMKQQ